MTDQTDERRTRQAAQSNGWKQSREGNAMILERAGRRISVSFNDSGGLSIVDLPPLDAAALRPRIRLAGSSTGKIGLVLTELQKPTGEAADVRPSARESSSVPAALLDLAAKLEIAIHGDPAQCGLCGEKISTEKRTVDGVSSSDCWHPRNPQYPGIIDWDHIDALTLELVATVKARAAPQHPSDPSDLADSGLRPDDELPVQAAFGLRDPDLCSDTVPRRLLGRIVFLEKEISASHQVVHAFLDEWVLAASPVPDQNVIISTPSGFARRPNGTLVNYQHRELTGSALEALLANNVSLQANLTRVSRNHDLLRDRTDGR